MDSKTTYPSKKPHVPRANPRPSYRKATPAETKAPANSPAGAGSDRRLASEMTQEDIADWSKAGEEYVKLFRGRILGTRPFKECFVCYEVFMPSAGATNQVIAVGFSDADGKEEDVLKQIVYSENSGCMYKGLLDDLTSRLIKEDAPEVVDLRDKIKSECSPSNTIEFCVIKVVRLTTGETHLSVIGSDVRAHQKNYMDMMQSTISDWGHTRVKKIMAAYLAGQGDANNYNPPLEWHEPALEDISNSNTKDMKKYVFWFAGKKQELYVPSLVTEFFELDELSFIILEPKSILFDYMDDDAKEERKKRNTLKNPFAERAKELDDIAEEWSLDVIKRFIMNK